jgi:hypothetical protein
MDCKKYKYGKFDSSENIATAFRHYGTSRRAMWNCVLSSFRRPIILATAGSYGQPSLYHKHEELSVVFQQQLTFQKVHGKHTSRAEDRENQL